MLLFHEDIHLIHGIGRAVFFDVVGERLSKSNEGNAAFMKDGVTHIGLFKPWTDTYNYNSNTKVIRLIQPSRLNIHGVDFILRPSN
jgi:hypothetical protein